MWSFIPNLTPAAAVPAALLGGFVLGSLPFGYWLGRLRGVNLLKAGSGSIGATNVFRNLGWRLGVLSFLLDMGKGAAAVRLAMALVPATAPAGREVWVLLAGVMAVASHSASFWIGFKGGRGVATGLGMYMALAWLPALLSFGVWVVTLAATRYVSVSSVLGVLSAVLWAWLFGLHPVYIAFVGLAVAVIVLRHLPNMRRLVAGTEPRIGRKREARDG